MHQHEMTAGTLASAQTDRIGQGTPTPNAVVDTHHDSESPAVRNGLGVLRLRGAHKSSTTRSTCARGTPIILDRAC